MLIISSTILYSSFANSHKNLFYYFLLVIRGPKRLFVYLDAELFRWGKAPLYSLRCGAVLEARSAP